MDTQQRIRRFIIENFYVADESMLAADSQLIRDGIVDSTGILEVIAFIEAELGVKVGDEDMVPENLGSIAAISAFVERRRREAA